MSEEFRRNQYIKIIDPLSPLATTNKAYFVQAWELNEKDDILAYYIRLETTTLKFLPSQVRVYKASNRQSILVSRPDEIPAYEKAVKFDLSKNIYNLKRRNKHGK